MKGRDEEICGVVWVGKRILEWVYVLSKEISLVHHKEVSEVKKKPREFDVVRCVQRGYGRIMQYPMKPIRVEE